LKAGYEGLFWNSLGQNIFYSIQLPELLYSPCPNKFLRDDNKRGMQLHIAFIKRLSFEVCLSPARGL